MVPDKTSYGAHHDRSVALTVEGGSPGVQWYSGTVTPKEFEEALRRSILGATLFREFADRAGADYVLTVHLMYAGSHPGFTMWAWVNTLWSVDERATGKSVWSKEIKTEGKATVGDAFVGATRQIMALERAAQANIEGGLTELGSLRLGAPAAGPVKPPPPAS